MSVVPLDVVEISNGEASTC